jgi:hypothetical protein
MTDDRRPDQSPALGHPQRAPDRKRPGRAVLQSFSIIARPAGSDVDEALEQFGSEGCRGVSSLRGDRGERRIRAGLKTKRANGASGVLGKG